MNLLFTEAGKKKQKQKIVSTTVILCIYKYL